MRGVNGGSTAVNSTLNAAATAIITAESRVQHTTTKRKGSGFWSMYWCFGSHKNNKRIGHALFLSESGRSEQPAALSSESLNSEGRLVVLPFVAPPSSPTSFDPSEPPSAALSPVNMFSASSGMYSPSGPTNIFAIGPYSNEPQLVSPPVFSTFTTEPSTAPVTPPPEYVHLTTPSSPEVPFARLLDPTNNNSEVSRAFPLSQYVFQSDQYYPGSPVGQLISPCSGISSSGTSSPFEHVVGSRSLQFPSTGRPKFLTLDKKPAQDWGSRIGSGSLTPDSAGPRKALTRDGGSRIGSGSVTPDSTGHWKPGKDWGSRIGSGSLTPDTASRRSRESCILDLQNYIISHAPNMGKSASKFESLDGQGLGHGPNAEPVVDHRVSFELSAMDVLKCVEKKQAAWTPSPFADVSSSTPGENLNPATTAEEQQTAQRRSIFTLGSGKEFNFDNIVVGSSSSRRSDVLSVGSDWWANEKIVAEDGEACEGWPFFSAAHSTSTAR